MIKGNHELETQSRLRWEFGSLHTTIETQSEHLRREIEGATDAILELRNLVERHPNRLSLVFFDINLKYPLTFIKQNTSNHAPWKTY